MGAQRKPRCFVAMAFDHDDTDEIYDHAIKPILVRNRIQPIIINRREDNRDINNQIIDQLNRADFCIADLTYTRPSVYFEAGYAQREIEVIYTVRSDHLKRNQSEELRVHFDLQMKPLITWKNADDSAFAARLERRLKQTVLKDWNRAQQTREKEKMQREDFMHMPLNERLVTIRKSGLRALNKLEFSSWEFFIDYRYGGRLYFRSPSEQMTYRQMLGHLNSVAWVISSTRKKRTLSVASLRVDESLTLKKLRDEFGARFLRGRSVSYLNGTKMLKETRPVKKSVEHHVLCSLKKIPQARIMSAMPSLRWVPELQCYRANVKWSYMTVSVGRSVTVHFIDGIASIPKFEAAMEAVVGRIRSNEA